MVKGIVGYISSLRGGGIEFASVDFNPHVVDVEKVTVECKDSKDVRVLVYVEKAATQDAGKAIARVVAGDTLNRLSYLYGVPLLSMSQQSAEFVDVNGPPGAMAVEMGCSLTVTGHVTLVVDPAKLKAELEQQNVSGARHFGMFRSALRSTSDVEAYMHLYNLLLMLYNDEQVDVDAYIVSQEPGVPQTQHPKKKPGKLETVYTRLRNEFAHLRPGVNLDDTKKQMAERLHSLKELTKKAIAANP